MNKKMKIVIPVIAGVLAISSGIGVVAARNADQNTVNPQAIRYDVGPGHCGGYGGMMGYGAGLVTPQVAALLGTTPADLEAQLETGKTLAEIAAAQGVSQDQLLDTLIAPHQEHIDIMVKNGYLLQDQADDMSQWMRERLQAVITSQVNDDDDGWGYMGGMMGRYSGPQPGNDATPRQGYGGMMRGFGRGMMGW